MLPDLEQMLELQSIDQELARLNNDINRFQPVLAGVTAERARRTAAAARREKQLHDLTLQRKSHESDLKTAETKVQRLRSQQEQVRTAKEAEALEHEIQLLESRIGTLEEQILASLEKEDEWKRLHAEKLAQEAQQESQSQEEEKRLKLLKTEKEDLARDLRGDRKAAVERLTPDLRDQYEWLVKRHGPTAVVSVDEGSCGGCGTMLVRQMAIQAQMGNELVQCNQCRRFLKS